MTEAVRERAAPFTSSARPPRLAILGGGPAGLASAHFAKKAGMPFVLLEAAAQVGGNARTFHEGCFRFDSGAHRFHDKDPEMTREVRSLLGSDLLECDIPSRIFHQGGWVDFPLSPLDLLRSLGVAACARALASLFHARLRQPVGSSFESHAIRTYGRDIAGRFLLGYSEKLWGLPCHRLSPRISGSRLKGLNVRTLLLETVLGRRAKTEHLDGAFFYPRLGFGMIADRLGDAAGREHIRTGARVTRILHRGGRVDALEVNGTEILPVEQVISTLPLPLLARLIDPPLPDRVLDHTPHLRCRNIVLAAIFFDRPSITQVGSVYFPDAGFPMTRVSEPKNRSAAMAPSGRTMLSVEIPCNVEDPLWQASDSAILEIVKEKLAGVGWIRPKDLLGGCVKRLPSAYPVLELGVEGHVNAILEGIRHLENLESIGRNGAFHYNHTHDNLRFGQTAVANIRARVEPTRSAPTSRA